jgi:hypothetical protein
MSGILQKGARRFTTQIGAAGVPDAVATTIPLVSTTGLPTDTQIEIVIDRTDGSGVLTPNKEEVVRGTVSGLNLINCIRGVEGTAQAHGAGATVNSFLTASMWNNVIDYIRDTPSRGLIGGVINVSVASNNLTVAVKTLQGTDPSPSNPVGIIINNTLRSITSALSVTANAGTNWFNSGSAELATREIDYFVYAGYNATDGITLGYARIPYAKLYSDFNTTTTNEKYARISTITNAASGDNYVNVGRFAATLSAGAGHTWSVPTFTNANLIQEPCYETRWRVWAPTVSGSGSMTLSVGTVDYARYKIVDNNVFISLQLNNYTTGGSASNFIRASLPITQTSIIGNWRHGATYFVNNGANTVGQFGFGTSGVIEFGKSDVSNLTLGTGYYAGITSSYEI